MVDQIQGKNVEGARLVSSTTTTTKTEGTPVLISTFSDQKVTVKRGGIEQIIFANKEQPAVGEDGEINFAKENLTDEQLENLNKLQAAKDFMKTEDGKKMAESLLKQEGDISKGQRKFLKKRGIDPDAFLQEWNRLNPESPNNKAIKLEDVNDNRNQMAAFADGHMRTNDGDYGVANKKTNEDYADKPDPNGLEGLFKKDEKSEIELTNRQEHRLRVDIHSTTSETREDSITGDVSDEIARAGEDLLESFAPRTDGKRRATIKQIDENGNETVYKVRYNKDGSVKRVRIMNDETGTLTVKKERDGDMSIRGDLQAKGAIVDSQAETTIENTVTNNYLQENTVETVTDNTYLRTETEIIYRDREVIVTPDTDPVDLEGGTIQDNPEADMGEGRGSGQFGVVSGDDIREGLAAGINETKKTYGAQGLVKAFLLNTEENMSEQDKMFLKTPLEKSKHNARKLTQVLINNPENPSGKVDHNTLAAVVNEYMNTNIPIDEKMAVLKEIKDEIIRHNKRAKENGYEGWDSTVERTNEPVRAFGAIGMLMKLDFDE